MQSVFDTEAARYFARILSDRSNDMSALLAEVNQDLLNLQATWRDQKYDAFSTEFETATKRLKEFLEHSERYATYLESKADHYDRYLGR